MKNRVCKLLNIKYPIIQAPIGSASCPVLASSVSNAGGLGMLAISWLNKKDIRHYLKETKNLTNHPFGVNVVLEWPQLERVKVCLEEGVKIISTFWGDPSEIVKIAHDSNAVVLHTVGSAQEAKEAASKGVDIIVGQGWEAGGHVYSDVALHSLIPNITEQVTNIPVIAAGGIANGKGIVSAFSLGAEAVWLGTRFLASKEANINNLYKKKVLDASENDTLRTKLFNIGWPNAPHRVIKNSTVKKWQEAGSPSIDRPNENEVVAKDSKGEKVLRYSDTIPTPDVEGDLEALALYAGQSVGLIKNIKSAREIVSQLISETKLAKNDLVDNLTWAT